MKRRTARPAGCSLLLAGAAVLGCGRSADRTVLATAAPGAYVADRDAGADADAGPVELEPTLDPRQAQLLSFLENECRGCHDGTPDSLAGNLYDLQTLIESGMIRPGLAQASKLMLWLQYGDTRPEHAGLGASREQFDALSGFINDYRYGGGEQCGTTFTGRDRIVADLVADIRSRPEADRAFIRYVTFNYATDAGICGGALLRPLGAVQELSNATSRGAVLVAPEWLELDAPVLALDIRDYAWNRPLDVDGDGAAEFADAWQAIVNAAAPYALELSGSDADALKAATGTAIPVVPGNAFVTAAGDGPLYYALIGVGTDIRQLTRSLGVQRDGDAVPTPARAGTFGDQHTPARVVSRFEQTAHPGRGYWLREQLTPGADGTWLGRLEAAPFDYVPDSHEAIFQLPNGMLAYVLGSSDGTPLGSVPACLISGVCATDLRVSGTMTCRGCHASRYFPVQDQVAPFASANPERFDAATLARISAEYGQGTDASFDRDMTIALDAVFSLSQSTDFNVITDAYYTFLNARISATTAAGELGTTVVALTSALDRLRTAGGANAAALDALRSGDSIDRATFSSLFLPLACALEGNANRPVSCP